MASRLIVPFDNNPISTTVKTASYTIPVGRYALVKPFFTSSPRSLISAGSSTTPAPYLATLNGVTVAYSSAQLVGLSTTGTTVSTANSLGIVRATISANANSTLVSYGGANVASLTIGGSSEVTLEVVAGLAFATASVVCYYNIYQLPSQDTIGNDSFWVKSGDVLSGTTSWNWMVTEYNAIS